jgi:hypothetical protein
MLGITVPDAIAFGSLVIGLVALFRGTQAGEKAKKVAPPDPAMAIIGSSLVDTGTLRELVRSVDRVAEAMEGATEDRKHTREGEMADTLKKLGSLPDAMKLLLQELSDRDDERARSGPPRRR